MLVLCIKVLFVSVSVSAADIFTFPGVSSWQQWTAAVHPQTTRPGPDDISDESLFHATWHRWNLGERSCRQGSVRNLQSGSVVFVSCVIETKVFCIMSILCSPWVISILWAVYFMISRVIVMHTVVLVVQWLGTLLMIERSLVRIPAGVLSSQLGQLSLPSLRGR